MDQFQSLLPHGKSVNCLDDLGSLSVKELKNILLSYRGKVSGVKADLILRVFAIYSRLERQEKGMPSTAASSSIVDGESFTYHALFESRCGHLPWISDLRNTPYFTFVQLYDYLVIRTMKFKHIALKSTGYKKLKSFQFFYEGYIKKFSVAKDNNFTFFDVRMKAAMKNTLYKVLVVLSNSTGDVCSAACTCPAGIGLGGFGNCNHVGGVLFALEDFNRKGYQDCPKPVSCTSKLSSWNVPASLKSILPQSIDEIVIQKLKFGKDNVNPKKPKCYDPRALEDRKLNEEGLEKLKSKLASCLPNSTFFSFYKLTESPSSISTEIVSSLNSPFDNSDVNLCILEDSVPFNNFYDISCSGFKEMMEYFCSTKSNLGETEIKEIEELTRGQASNETWKFHRMYRITASNFYTAAVNSVEPSRKLHSMYYSSFSSASTHHGKTFESHIRSLYSQQLSKEDGCNILIEEHGLIISKTHSYLGASLDGIVKCNGNVWGIEIKAPFSKFNSPLSEALLDKRFFLMKKNEVVKLKRNSKYFFQIQGQMFCSGLKRIDLVVWFGDDHPLFIETVKYDENFMQTCVLPQLKFFYCRAVLPEYHTRRVQRGEKLYLQGGWENFSKKKKNITKEA